MAGQYSSRAVNMQEFTCRATTASLAVVSRANIVFVLVNGSAGTSILEMGYNFGPSNVQMLVPDCSDTTSANATLLNMMLLWLKISTHRFQSCGNPSPRIVEWSCLTRQSWLLLCSCVAQDTCIHVRTRFSRLGAWPYSGPRHFEVTTVADARKGLPVELHASSVISMN